MSFDKFIDPAELWQERQKAVQQSLRSIAVDELREIANAHQDEFVGDPWRDEFLRLMTDHPNGSFYHAVTQEDAEVFYCGDEDFGVWVVPGSGSGPLDANAKRIVRDAINSAARGEKNGGEK